MKHLLSPIAIAILIAAATPALAADVELVPRDDSATAPAYAAVPPSPPAQQLTEVMSGPDRIVQVQDFHDEGNSAPSVPLN